MVARDRTDAVVVTTAQMQAIEARMFAAGMPVAALMEKVAGAIARRVQRYPFYQAGVRVLVLVGPGHNGGDALVVARELHLAGCVVQVYQPLARLKELTASHAAYCRSLGMEFTDDRADLRSPDFVIDGLFGFGLERAITGELAAAIAQINQFPCPIVSIDLPSGVHTDTGAVLGTAIRATHTLCLGLWKRGLLQEAAVAWVGQVERLGFDIPWADVQAVIGTGTVERITPESAIAHLPLARSPLAHKYTVGHLLLVCGSRQYAGAACLAGLGARASGVGMVTIAVPESLKAGLNTQLPEALIVGCPETETGAIAQFPLDLSRYDAIACGPGLTLDALPLVQQVLASDRPLVLDADGLNALAQLGTEATLRSRTALTILTPHWGEFQRLFPAFTAGGDRLSSVQQAAQSTAAIVLLKGARTAIADPTRLSINPDSTPALARGGSGDVLTGLIGGLVAQAIAAKHPATALDWVAAAAWWHAQAGLWAAAQRTVLGVDPVTLAASLLPALAQFTSPHATTTVF